MADYSAPGHPDPHCGTVSPDSGVPVPSTAKHPGPFPVLEEQSAHQPHEPALRQYDCPAYEECLNLAAALDWSGFTCFGCSGVVNENLRWRACQALKKDSVARRICDVPEIQVVSSSAHQEMPLKVVGKT